METDLEKLLAVYRKDGTHIKEIMNLIATRVYENPKAFGIRCEDDIGEMFSRFWVRIEKLINRYEENGSSFEAYLVTTLRFISLTLYRERVVATQSEITYINDSGELSAAESASRYSCLTRHRPSSKTSSIKIPRLPGKKTGLSPALSQHLSILCVKCAILVSDDDVIAIAMKIGVNPQDLLDKVRMARGNAERRIRRREYREELRNSIWFKMLLKKRKLATEYDCEKRNDLKIQIANLALRYKTTIADLGHMKLTISNKELATLFNVTKTRVDSGQFRLRNQFSVQDEES